MHIRFAMLAIVAFALGGALARGQASEPITQAWLRGGPYSARLKIVAGNELTAIALVGGSLMVFQTLRGRGAGSTWGVGRWIWSVSALFVVFNLSSTLLVLLTTEYRRVGICPPREIQLRVMHAVCTQQFLNEFAWAIPAIALTRRWSGIERLGMVDLCEYSGRLFGALVVISTLSIRLLQAFLM